jgi:integrase/recombinase XerC
MKVRPQGYELTGDSFTSIPSSQAAAAEIDQIPEWFSQFLNDRQTRETVGARHEGLPPGFIAIATQVAGDDPSRLAITDMTKDTMRNAFAACARDHEAASIRRWRSTWNVLCPGWLSRSRRLSPNRSRSSPRDGCERSSFQASNRLA